MDGDATAAGNALLGLRAFGEAAHADFGEARGDLAFGEDMPVRFGDTGADLRRCKLFFACFF